MSTPSSSRNDGIGINAAESFPTSGPTPTPGPPGPSRRVPLGDTLTNITTIGKSIEKALTKISNNAPNKQELVTSVQLSTAGAEGLFSGITFVSPTAKTCADDLYRRLQDAHAHLHLYGTRTKVKGKLKTLFGLPSNLSPTYHLQIQSAFDTLKASFTSAVSANAQDVVVEASSALATPEPAGSDIMAVGARRPADVANETAGVEHVNDVPKKDGPWSTVVDAVEGGLRILSSATDFIPDPAGPIVKLMAGTGLTIIETLKDMIDNREEAMDLGRYVGTLIQTAGRFLEGSDGRTNATCDAETVEQLRSFLDALNALQTDLAQLRAQGRFKQGVSHKSNKDDLKKWELRINRAFTSLQTQLSLDSIRLLTNMNAADALRERDRLINLLGDANTGATEKAADSADLMCLPGTRTEVLDQVEDWIADANGSRIFWISGVAGCGKSAVAATIAGRERAIPISTAVFYFVRGNQERNARVVCSLSQQLARFGHGSLEHFILGAVKAHPDIAASHLNTQFQHLIIEPLKKLVSGSPPVVLIMDALDEWANHDATVKLVELIEQAHAELPTTVRFVLASRNEPHLVRSLDCASIQPLVTRYPLDAVLKTDAGRDIQAYIEKRFAKICAKSNMVSDGHPWPEEGNIGSLVVLSDGLFQWASTVVSFIEAKRPRGRLREILSNPERFLGLDNLYKEVLSRSFQEEMDERVALLLRDVLGSILMASIPIGATTIAYLCYDSMNALEETMELIQEEILPSLASLFIIPKDPEEPITVSHRSVLEYFTDMSRCPDVRFFIDPVVHHTRMFNICLGLMESNLKPDICGIHDPSKPDVNLEDEVKRHIPPRLRYSCQYWTAHLVGSGHGVFTESCARLGTFSRNHLQHWLEVLSLIEDTARAVSATQQVESWFLSCPSLLPADVGVKQLWKDTSRYLAMFTGSEQMTISISAAETESVETEHGTKFGQIVCKLLKPGLRVIQGETEKQWAGAVWTARGHTGNVCCVALSPDGSAVASGSFMDDFQMWDTHSGAPRGEALKKFTSSVFSMSFSRDGTLLVSGSHDGSVQLWDTQSGAPRSEPLEGHTAPVFSVCFSPDGRSIASGSNDHTIRLWDVEFGSQISKVLTGHSASVYCLSFSSDGRTIVSVSSDGVIRVWDAVTRLQKGEALTVDVLGMANLRLSSDGSILFVMTYIGQYHMWDITDAVSTSVAPLSFVPRKLQNHTRPVFEGYVSPEGRIYNFGIFWLWVPFRNIPWLLSGNWLALYNSIDVYIIDVTEVLPIIE